MSGRLAGKVAVITAAAQGIGRATVLVIILMQLTISMIKDQKF